MEATATETARIAMPAQRHGAGLQPAVRDVFERTEKKYLLASGQYEFLMRAIQDRLGYDQFGQSLISSLYYDTATDEMINRSLEKPLYKEKLRIRAYGNPGPGDTVFVELKKKFKGIVYKRRMAMSRQGAAAYMAGMPYLQACQAFPQADEERQAECAGAQILQIVSEIDACKARYSALSPKMMIVTNRIAMRTTDGSDVRITFDVDPAWRNTDLSFADGLGGTLLLPDGQIIMEVKCLRAYPLWLAQALTSGGIYPVSCSKYGRAYQMAHPARQPRGVAQPIAYRAPEPKPTFFGHIASLGTRMARGGAHKEGASCA